MIQNLLERIDKSQPTEAVRQLSEIKEKLTDTISEVDNHLFSLIQKIPTPRLHDLPENNNLCEELKKIREEYTHFCESNECQLAADNIILQAHNLIRACINYTTPEYSITIARVLFDLLITWDLNDETLTWRIKQTQLPWPAVHVEARYVNNNDELETRTLYTAPDVLDHLITTVLNYEKTDFEKTLINREHP